MDVTTARLVARGYEELEPIQEDLPAVSWDGFRTSLFIASTHQWNVKTTDIKAAFLQGQTFERDVYINPPKQAGVKDSIFWHLNTCLYGLNNAAGQFHLSFKEALLKLTCTQATLDPALFFYYQDNKLCSILACHVDYFLHAGNYQFQDNIMAPLQYRFLVGKLGETIFKYIRFNIHQSLEGIMQDQQDYINSLDIPIIESKRMSQKLDSLTSSTNAKLLDNLIRQFKGHILI